ncbi:MAG: hypothetical protein JWN45_97 [Acidobacteriaceae bacterium]|nr:hypothetical protein [Acidobacteriaceae bacterium]
MKANWESKTDPVHHPVRFLAGVWQQRMKERFGITGVQFTPKEFGQLKRVMNAFGDLSREVIEWMLDPVNWWHFCQQVRSELGIHFVPDYPEVGFLLGYRGVGLNLMYSKLRYSIEWADFINRLEKKKYEQTKNLLLLYAVGKPGELAKIEAAKTLSEIELLFNEMLDDDAVQSA